MIVIPYYVPPLRYIIIIPTAAKNRISKFSNGNLHHGKITRKIPTSNFGVSYTATWTTKTSICKSRHLDPEVLKKIRWNF
jgi:hypothetical protein